MEQPKEESTNQRVWTAVLLAFLVFFWLFQTVSSLSVKSMTSDEDLYLRSAVSLVRGSHWQQRVNVMHAPLTAYVHGWLPLRWGQEDLADRLLPARLLNLVWGLLLGFYLFLWARRLNGRRGALFVLTLWAFSPNLLAHSRLVTPDICFVSVSLASTYHLWSFAAEHRLNQLLLSAVYLGLALLSKYTAVLMSGVLLPLLLWAMLLERRSVWRMLSAAGILLGVSFFILVLGYGFQGAFSSKAGFLWQSAFFDNLSQTLLGRGLLWFFPLPYLNGLDFQKYFTEYGFLNYLMGEFSVKGFPNYYAVAMAVKTPLSLLILFLLSLLCIGRLRWTDRAFLLWPPLVFFVYFSFVSEFQIGLRHVLLIYPFAFLFIAAAILPRAGDSPRRLWSSVLAGLCLIGFVLESALIYPHYLAFFNRAAGGPERGDQWLIDSNLDWQQDLGFVEAYIADHPGVRLEPPEPATGLVLASVNSLRGYLGSEGQVEWLLDFEPVDYIGYSWKVYQITLGKALAVWGSGPENSEARLRLVSLYREEGLLDKAKTLLLQGLEGESGLDSRRAQILGDIYRRERNLSGALKQMRRAAESPHSYRVFEDLAWLELESGEGAPGKHMRLAHHHRMLESYLRAPVMPDPRTEMGESGLARLRTRCNQGYWAWADGDLDTAVKLTRAVVEKEPWFVDAWANLAYLYEEAGDYGAALEAQQEYMQRVGNALARQDPRWFYHGGLVFGRTLVLNKRQAHEEGLQRRILVLKNEFKGLSPEEQIAALLEMGRLYAVLGRWPQALASLHQAQGLQPESLQVRAALKELYSWKKNWPML
ncbi:MAG: glycosyltransferase family 39 protein [Candidatus Omnitrophica bacterium]|nr:glycosyltransferase family 39 protein [Candidatus Omnitrophota bacterium]